MPTFSFFDPPKWMVGTGAALGTATLAAIAGIWLSYSDFRGKKLEQISAVVEMSVQSEADLRRLLLDRFIPAINDKATLTEDDRTKLAQATRQAYDKAEDARNRLGALQQEFQQLGDALVALKDASDKFTNALNGKQFFIAYSQWIGADQDWRQEIQRRQNSYWASLRF